MPNIILTPTVFSRGVAMNLGGYLHIARNMTHEYEKEFGNKAQKIGATFNVRKPQRFEGTENVAYTPEPVKNIFSTITVDKTFGIHFEWDIIEKTLKIEDAQNRYFKPAAIRIAHQHNAKAGEFIAKNTSNTIGTPGVTPGGVDVPTLLGNYLGAGDKLVEQGLPENEDMYCIISRAMSSAFVGRVSALFTPTELIGKQYKTGWVDPTGLGYRWYKDQGLWTHVAGTLLDTTNATAIDGPNQVAEDGNNSFQTLNLKGFDSSATVNLGDWFTIANVFSVHPQTKVSTGQLQQFKVMANATATAGGTGASTMTVSIFPAITPTGQYQNVDSVPADSAEVIFDEGAHTNHDVYASVSSRMGLLMHQNAHAFVSCKMEEPEPGMGVLAAQEQDDRTGTWISVTRSWDNLLRRQISRLDSLFGFGYLYREMACIILAAH